MKVATINAELFPAIAIKYHIISYPTVKLFSEKYEGKELSTNMTTLKVNINFCYWISRMKYLNT